VYGFSAFYWDVGELAEEDRRAVAGLDSASPPLPSAGYATHDPDGLLEAYRTLLHSTDVRARGVALDQYTYACAQGRWGADNPMARLDDEVLAQARGMLAVAPEPAVPLADQPRVTACWNSALGVLAFLTDGSTTDLPRIVEVLESAFAEDLLDIYSLWALGERMVDADERTCARVGAWLAATFTDARLPLDVRVAAVKPFTDHRYGARLGHRSAIAGLLDQPEIRLSIAAAWVLADIDDPYRQAVRQAVAGWPEDAPYPADEVRDRLAAADELARARATLAALAGRARSSTPPPVDVEAVIGALATLTEHGDPTDVLELLVILDNGDLARDLAEYAVAEPADVEDVVAFGTAVNHCLETADEPTVQDVNTRLAAVFTDAQVPSTVRALAIRPFWTDTGRWTEHVALTGLLDHDDLRLSTAAAFALVGRAGYEPLVRRSVARWPGEAPYPAGEVRTILADIDALTMARGILAASADPLADPPVDVAILIGAVDIVLRDGDDMDVPGLLALVDGGGIAAVIGRSDRGQADELAAKLRSAVRWQLPDGAGDPRYTTAVERLAALLPDQP